MVGEKERNSNSSSNIHSNNNNNSRVVVSNGPNYLSNDLINNQNLQYEIISNQSDWWFVTTINLSMQTDNQIIFSSFILKSESIHIDSFNYVDCLKLICILGNVDCLKLICILGICLFSHIEFVLHFDHSTYQSNWSIIQNRSVSIIDWLIDWLIHGNNNTHISNNMTIIMDLVLSLFLY